MSIGVFDLVKIGIGPAARTQASHISGSTPTPASWWPTRFSAVHKAENLEHLRRQAIHPPAIDDVGKPCDGRTEAVTEAGVGDLQA